MAYVFKPYEKAVGSFIILTTAVLLGAGIYIVRHKTAETQKYFAYYDSGSAMRKDMGIYYNGIQVGKATDVKLMDDDKVRITFNVEPGYTNRVKTDSIAYLNEGLMGNSITITRGSPGAPLMASGERLWSTDDPQGRKIMASLHKKVVPPERIDNIVANVLNLIGILTKEDGPVMSLLATADGIMDQIQNNENSIGAILGDKKLLKTRLDNILLSLDEMMMHFKVISQRLDNQGLRGIIGGEKKSSRSGGATIDKTEKFSTY